MAVGAAGRGAASCFPPLPRVGSPGVQRPCSWLSVTQAREGGTAGGMTCPWGVWAVNASLQYGALQRESGDIYQGTGMFQPQELWQLL